MGSKLIILYLFDVLHHSALYLVAGMFRFDHRTSRLTVRADINLVVSVNYFLSEDWTFIFSSVHTQHSIIVLEKC